MLKTLQVLWPQKLGSDGEGRQIAGMHAVKIGLPLNAAFFKVRLSCSLVVMYMHSPITNT